MRTTMIICWMLLGGLLLAGCSSNGGQVTDSRPMLEGTVNYRARIALPPTAVLTVRLLDVSKKDVPAIVLAEKSYSNPGNPPMEFQLPYPFGGIHERRSYVIEARIEINGRLKFASMKQHVVTPQNASQAHEVWLELAEE